MRVVTRRSYQNFHINDHINASDIDGPVSMLWHLLALICVILLLFILYDVLDLGCTAVTLLASRQFCITLLASQSYEAFAMFFHMVLSFFTKNQFTLKCVHYIIGTLQVLLLCFGQVYPFKVLLSLNVIIKPCARQSFKSLYHTIPTFKAFASQDELDIVETFYLYF